MHCPVPIPADGACFLRCVQLAINTKEDPKDLAEFINRIIGEYPHLFLHLDAKYPLNLVYGPHTTYVASNMQEHIDFLQTAQGWKVWTEDYQIQAICSILHLRITIFCVNSDNKLYDIAYILPRADQDVFPETTKWRAAHDSCIVKEI